MLIAHITDLHVVEKGQLAYRTADTGAMLAKAVAKINALRPRPDVVLLTGDIADHGKPEEYAYAKEILDALQMPLLVGIGNHDNRVNFNAAFSDRFSYLPKSGFVQYAIEDFALRIVFADSTSATSHYAEFCPERVTWLDKTLSERPDAPTIVTLHHPPCNTGIKWMDGVGDDWAAGLESVLRKHRQVLRVLVGHVHRPITSDCGGRIVSMGPSTGLQVALQIDPDFDIKVDMPEFELEPAGFQLLSWDGRRLVGDVVHTDDYERVLPMTREQLDAFLASQHPGPAAKKIYTW